MSTGPENKFRKALCERIKEMRGDRCYIQKNHGTQFSSGLPDVWLHDREWGSTLIELKALKAGVTKSGIAGAWFNFSEQPTDLQFATLKKAYLAGLNASVVLWNDYHEHIHRFPFVELRDLRDAGLSASGFELAAGGVTRAAAFADPMMMKLAIWGPD